MAVARWNYPQDPISITIEFSTSVIHCNKLIGHAAVSLDVLDTQSSVALVACEMHLH